MMAANEYSQDSNPPRRPPDDPVYDQLIGGPSVSSHARGGAGRSS